MRAVLGSARSLVSRRVRAITRHLPSDNLIGTIYSTPNGVFSIAASDISLANVLRRNLAWADDEVDAICSVTGTDARVLIVGAHVGTLAIPVARHVREVVAIEAKPDTYRFFSANLALNDVANVISHCFAAGEEDGEIEFLKNRQNSGGAKRRPIVDDARYVYDRPELVRVPMRRVDDLVDGAFETIVMDIEGSEVFALRGMRGVLSKADRLFIEFLPHHLRNVAGVDSDAFCDLILPYLPIATITGRRCEGQEVRDELRRMFDADQGDDLICFSRAT